MTRTTYPFACNLGNKVGIGILEPVEHSRLIGFHISSNCVEVVVIIVPSEKGDDISIRPSIFGSGEVERR
jgi:hypothetical protein